MARHYVDAVGSRNTITFIVNHKKNFKGFEGVKGINLKVLVQISVVW